MAEPLLKDQTTPLFCYALLASVDPGASGDVRRFTAPGLGKRERTIVQMELRAFLLAILTGTFAIGPAIYLLLENIPQFKVIDPQYKRWIVAGLAGVLGVGAWALSLWFGYVETPAAYSPEFIANGLWQYGVLVGLAGFTSSQLIHGSLATKPTQE